MRDTTRAALVLGAVLGCFGYLAITANAQELIGHWEFEETDLEQLAIDSSDSENHGTFEGDMELGEEGVFGLAAYFDGFTGQVHLGPGDETGYGDITENFTVMAWIKPEHFDSKNRVFGSAPWEANSGWGWGTNGTQLEITTWGVRDYDQPADLEEETWVHAAIALDEDFTAHFYLDGEFMDSLTHDAGGGPTINDFYIGWAAVEGERFTGYLDDVAIFDGVLTEEQINNAMTLGAASFNGEVDDPWAVLSDGSLTDPVARSAYVRDELNSWIGDSNKDGMFDSSDFVFVFTAGQYEDDVDGNSTWETGDWNGDMDFDSSDFVAAFTDGGFEMGPRTAVAAVPEPHAMLLVLIGSLSLAGLRRRK